MASSNRVRIAAIPETTYGETPAVGDFETARITSESLSGSPDTTESQSIRADRQASGQVVTGLTLGGDVNGELAKEDIIDGFMESAMYSTWSSSAPVNADLDIEATNRTLDRAAGDFNVDVEIGDVITLAGFSNATNNTQVMVARIISATQISFIGPDDLVTESSTGNTFTVSDKMEIGVTKKSYSIEKEFQDLTEKAIIYRGMIASTMSVNVAFGEIANYTFNFAGNGYDPVEAQADFITDGRTVNAPATSNIMNGSVDMAFLGDGSTDSFIDTSYCIQSLDMTLNNNLTPQNCIGRVAPLDQTEGTASIEVNLTVYMSDDNWQFLKKKLNQNSFEIGFIIRNADGYYAFFMPAVQVSGDDPAATGINQDVIVTFSGTAKIGNNNEKALKISRG